MYYQDIASISRIRSEHGKVRKFPFYDEARKAIPDEKEWKAQEPKLGDKDYLNAMEEFLSDIGQEDLEELFGGVQKPYVNPYAGIGRNDPCPCGSGKKFKKCCGMRTKG